MSFVDIHNAYHEGFEDGQYSLNLDLIFEEWSDEDKKKYNEIKERYLNDN